MEKYSEVDPETIPNVSGMISIGENMPAPITGGADTFDIDAEAQRLTDQYLGKDKENNKKRGGIISLK